MRTARLIRIGSKITASAITSTVVHMYENRTPVAAAPRRNVSLPRNTKLAPNYR